jgi:hypothetical protein
MGKLKDQLAGIAALVAAIVAIGGGFIKYGEIVTKLDAIEAREQTTVDTSAIESSIAVLEEKVSNLENVDTSHTHELIDHKHNLVDHKHDLIEHKHDLIEHDHPVDHGHTKTLVNEKEIELLKVQIEEIKVKATNPLAN